MASKKDRFPLGRMVELDGAHYQIIDGKLYTTEPTCRIWSPLVQKSFKIRLSGAKYQTR